LTCPPAADPAPEPAHHAGGAEAEREGEAGPRQGQQVPVPPPVFVQDLPVHPVEEVLQGQEGHHHVVRQPERAEDGFGQEVDGGEEVGDRGAGQRLLPEANPGIAGEPGKKQEEVRQEEDKLGGFSPKSAGYPLGPTDDAGPKTVVTAGRWTRARVEGHGHAAPGRRESRAG
jgi:hypothetical protein